MGGVAERWECSRDSRPRRIMHTCTEHPVESCAAARHMQVWGLPPNNDAGASQNHSGGTTAAARQGSCTVGSEQEAAWSAAWSRRRLLALQVVVVLGAGAVHHCSGTAKRRLHPPFPPGAQTAARWAWPPRSCPARPALHAALGIRQVSVCNRQSRVSSGCAGMAAAVAPSAPSTAGPATAHANCTHQPCRKRHSGGPCPSAVACLAAKGCASQLEQPVNSHALNSCMPACMRSWTHTMHEKLGTYRTR